MTLKRPYLLLAVIVLATVLLFLNKQDPMGTKAAVEGKSSAGVGVPAHEIAETSEATGFAPEGISNNEDPSSRTLAAFGNWFSQEAQTMETSSVDPQLKEALLRERARALNKGEMTLLKDKALNIHATANERILAVYLLSLVPEVTSGALIDLVQAPLALAGEHPVHSPEETLATQEKTLRRMAWDALVQKAQKDPQGREFLAKALSQITDRSLREYAEKSLEKLK